MTKLCVISGWANSTDSLHELATSLGETFEVHTKSPNQLRSTSYNGEEWSGYAETSSQWIASQETPVVLAGWSMGGMIAMELAASGKLPITALVLLSTTAKFCRAGDYRCGSPAAELRAFAMGIRHAPDTILTRFFNIVAKPDHDEREKIKELVREAREMGAAYLQDGLQYLLTRDNRPQLSQIKVPTLIAHGTEDNTIPFAAAQYVNEHLPGSTLLSMDGKGHDFPTRYPRETADRIKQFVQTM